jgi:DNA-binding NarL/FixJ family response regulator
MKNHEESAACAPRVLIIDDHVLLAESLKLALQDEGMSAQTACGPTVENILAAARSFEPDVVLLDLALGEVGSGISIIGTLRDLPARVIVLSGLDDRMLLAACIEAGAVGFVSKAVDIETVLDHVLRAARGEWTIARTDREVLLFELRRQRARGDDQLAPIMRLTPRERGVLGALMQGLPADTIARRAHLSLATVRSHIHSILVKLDVSSQLAAVALAYRLGWSPDTQSDELLCVAANS